MRKFLSFIALAGCFLLLCACSDDKTVPVSVELYGTWTQVNDADQTIETQITFTHDKLVNYGPTFTAVNQTIPPNADSYTIDTRTYSQLTPTPVVSQYVREQGYYTVTVSDNRNILTLWPQWRWISTDGSAWTVDATAPSWMETYTYLLNNPNVLVITSTDNTKRTFTSQGKQN